MDIYRLVPNVNPPSIIPGESVPLSRLFTIERVPGQALFSYQLERFGTITGFVGFASVYPSSGIIFHPTNNGPNGTGYIYGTVEGSGTLQGGDHTDFSSVYLTFTPAFFSSGGGSVTAGIQNVLNFTVPKDYSSYPLTPGLTGYTNELTNSNVNESLRVAKLRIVPLEADRAEDGNTVTLFTFTVTRFGITSDEETVSYTVAGSGSNPAPASDFLDGAYPRGTITFAAGETTKTLTVLVGNHFSSPASSENFTVTVSSSSQDTASADGTIRPPTLFTTGNDIVDFNLLNGNQIAAVGTAAPSYDALYNALAGNDTITLPDDAHAENLLKDNPGAGSATLVPFDLARTFHGGPGADTFDFAKDQGLNGYAAGKTLHIDGDTPAMGASAAAPYLTPTLDDTLKLPGSPGDYTFTVNYASALSGTHTVVSRSSVTTAGPAIPVNIDTANIELVTFAKPLVNLITLDKQDIYAEMARLCAEVYGPLKSNTHGNEPLASGFVDGDATTYGAEDGTNKPFDPVASTVHVGDRAVARGWHEVSAMELGLPPGSLDLQGYGGLRWSFANGLYQAIGPTGAPSYFPTTEANALVLSGVVGGQRTLCVIFRGTDETSDFGDYIDFRANHYDKFAPLVAALKTYVGDKNNQISQLLIGGHSLGGGVAQIFANEIGSMVQDTRLFTFGSPGAETPASVPQVNFFQTGDPVATVLSVASQPDTLIGAAAHVVAYAAAVAVISAGIQTGITGLVSEGVEAAKLMAQLQPKKRSGVDVPIGSDLFTAAPVSARVLDRVFAEHSMGLDNRADVVGAGYVSHIDKLVDYARDAASPFASSSMAGAMALS